MYCIEGRGTFLSSRAVAIYRLHQDDFKLTIIYDIKYIDFIYSLFRINYKYMWINTDSYQYESNGCKTLDGKKCLT